MSTQSTGAVKRIRVGAVSFLNALPLIEGLAVNPEIELVRAVPAKLPEMLDRGELDVALVPVIDLIRNNRDWHVVSDACIGSDGATLTVRVFSRVDPSEVHTLFADCDSHTSIALASVIWREKFGRELKLEPFRAGVTSADTLEGGEAILLIGDKVINPPIGLDAFSTQVDLGATWKSLTGLPFVFAVWARRHAQLDDSIAPILASARDAGVNMATQLAEQHAPRIGWPIALARSYLAEHLSYTLSESHRAGMQRFFDFVRRHNLLDRLEEPTLA